MLFDAVKFIAPARLTGRASMEGTPETVMVVQIGMVSVPLPLITPPLHVIEAPVRLMFAEPPNVPLTIVSVGIDCGDALLIAVVPPLTCVFVVIVPLTVFVPLCQTTRPAPPIVVAASNVRV